MNTVEPTVNELFDLVAPIAITGAVDCTYEKKAIKAWKKMVEVPVEIWHIYGCPNLHEDLEGSLSEWDLSDDDQFNKVHYYFVHDAYNRLFAAIVEENGDGDWIEGYDYWGARGFSRPGDTNRNFSLVGDACGHFPWYETAELLIYRMREIQDKVYY